MEILIVGGSNSVMKQGYSDQLAILLDQPDIIELTGSKTWIKNLSVGANSAMRGLETLKSADLDSVDILVLEYFINDLPMFSRDGAEFWLACYEGMIRYALSVNPRLRIVPLMLGRRDKRFYTIQEDMRDSMRALAEKYNLKLVDFDQFAHQHLTYQNQFTALYSDGAHYQRPQITSLIASQILLKILGTFSTPASDLDPSTVTPLNPVTFEGARAIDLVALAPEKFDRVRFHNSRYDVTAIALPVGEELHLPTDLCLLSISYVSAPTSGRMQIIPTDMSGVLVNTLHKKVQDGAFPFLLKTTPLAAWIKRPLSNLGPIALAAVAQGDSSKTPVIKEYNMIENAGDMAQAVYLVSAMAKG